MKARIFGLILASTLACGAAQASDVSWTVTVGSSRPAPRVIYAPPPVVYAPPPVVVQPIYQPAYQPVYQSVPVVYTQPGYYFAPGHRKHWRKHGHRHPHAVVVAPWRGHHHD